MSLIHILTQRTTNEMEAMPRRILLSRRIQEGDPKYERRFSFTSTNPPENNYVYIGGHSMLLHIRVRGPLQTPKQQFIHHVRRIFSNEPNTSWQWSSYGAIICTDIRSWTQDLATTRPIFPANVVKYLRGRVNYFQYQLWRNIIYIR